MTSPTYGTTYELSERTVLYWGRELSAAGTVTAAWTKEEFGTFSYTPNRNIWTNNFRAGFPSQRLGTQETWHYADLTITLPFHPNGLGAMSVLHLLGDHDNTGTTEVKSGVGDPYTHTWTPGVNGTRCPTFSFAFASLMDGGATPALQFLYATIKQVKLSGASGAPLMAEIQATSFWPTSVATPSGSWVTLEPYLFGFQSYHSVYQNASSGTKYTAQILDTDVTLSRQLTTEASYNNNGSQNPLDIIPLDLNLQANLTLYYDGMGTGKHYSEYLAYLKSGVVGTPNEFKWAATASPVHSIAIDAWPLAFSVDNVQTGAGVMSCQATLDAEQDFGTATQGSPALSLVKTVAVANNVSTVMVA